MAVLEILDLGLFYPNLVNWAFCFCPNKLNFESKIAKNSVFSNFTNSRGGVRNNSTCGTIPQKMELFCKNGTIPQ